MQGGVGDDQRGLERQAPSEVADGSRNRRDSKAVDLLDLVGVQKRGMNVHEPGPAAAGRRRPRDMDAVQGDVPQGQTMQDGGRRMAEHGVGSHLGTLERAASACRARAVAKRASDDGT